MIHLDERVFLWLNGLAGRWPALDWLIRLFVNDYFLMVLMSMVLLAVWFGGASQEDRKKLQIIVLSAATAIGMSGGIVRLLYEFIHRPRPFDYLPVHLLFYQPVDPSFPAKPAAVAFAGAFGLLLGTRRAGIVALVLASLFSIARVFAGVHFPLDILGGAAIGLLCALFGHWLLRVLRPLTSLVIEVIRRFGLA